MLLCDNDIFQHYLNMLLREKLDLHVVESKSQPCRSSVGVLLEKVGNKSILIQVRAVEKLKPEVFHEFLRELQYPNMEGSLVSEELSRFDSKNDGNKVVNILFISGIEEGQPDVLDGKCVAIKCMYKDD